MTNTERLGLVKLAMTPQTYQKFGDPNNVKAPSSVWSETAGRIVNPLMTGILGAGAGAGIGYAAGATGDDLGLSAIGGGYAGMLIPQIIAGITAAVKDTRTKEEQDEADADPNAAMKNLLIPGHAGYQHFKRKGFLADKYGHPLIDG